MSVDKAFCRGEKKLVLARVQYALDMFYANPCKESQIDVFDELTTAYIYNLDLIVPSDYVQKQITYRMYRHSSGALFYLACTTLEELKKCAGGVGIYMSIRNLFQNVISGSRPGLLLDPHNGHGVILFLSCENIRKITDRALSGINAQPEEVRTFLLDEI